jgi:hypothetical protein
MSVTLIPRALRPAPDPLGLFFHSSHTDHTVVAQLLSQGQRSFSGVVVGARRAQRQRELLKETARVRIDSILDPETDRSGTIGGFVEKTAALPWGTTSPAVPADFSGLNRSRRLTVLARFAVEHGFTQILAPTHFFRTTDDDWFELDLENVGFLRQALDREGGQHIQIPLLLCFPYSLLRDEDERNQLIDAIRGIESNAVWLRVSGCGADSTPTAIRNYAVACGEFAQRGLPLIADQMGGLSGLSLLSLGSVGGLASGLGVKERFSAANWFRPQKGKPYSSHPGVHLSSVDIAMKPKELRELLDNNPRLKGLVGCTDLECCPRGLVDMLERPAHHFAVQRMRQVAEMSQNPTSLRAKLFLENHIRPTTDRALQLANAAGLSEESKKRFGKHRRRVDSLRTTFAKLVESSTHTRVTRTPLTRVVRDDLSVLKNPLR